MSIKHNNMTVDTIPGKRIVKSSCVGKASVDDIKWLTSQLVTMGRQFGASGWVYIADISRMDPVAPDVSTELVTMTREIIKGGCKGIGFVSGTSFMLDAQAQAHQKQSNSSVPEGHFKTESEAIAWANGIL